MPEDPQITRIMEKVKRRQDAVAPLFERMDKDWRMYNLEKFKPRQGEGIQDVDAFTSNRPKIFADKLIGAIAGAKQIIRVQVDAYNPTERDINNDYERFGIGVLKICDDYLMESGGVPLRTDLATQVITQGGYAAARALLRKDDDGSTLVDVMPIQARNLLIQHGKREPLWAAIVTLRDRAAIRDEYSDFKFDEEDKPKDNDNQERVVDYYWKETSGKDKGKYMNCVIVDGKYALKPKDTFATRFPIVARAVGGHSLKPSLHSLDEYANGSTQIPGIESWAESAFAPIRNLMATKNRLMSYHLAMTGKGVRQVMKVKSSGGTKELPTNYEDSAGIQLDVDNSEDVEPLQLAELTRDAEKILGEVNIEEEDSTLPNQAYGRIERETSGNALRILNASIGERLEPFIRPIESCIEGVIEVLAAQYETGKYKPIKVSGKTRNRQGFARVIQPEDIAGRDRIMVEFGPNLPEDENQKWLTAQIATTPNAEGMPLASHLTAWEDILKLQDSDIQNERIFNQMARTSTPKMVLITRLVAAQRAGDEQTVQFLTAEIERITNREAMEEMAQKIAFLTMLFQNPLAAAAAGVGPGAGGGPGNANGGGLNAQGSARNPLNGIDPAFAGLSGIAPGSVQSPEEQQANQIGITLADQQQVRQYG